MVQMHSVPVFFVTQHSVSKHYPCFMCLNRWFLLLSAKYTISFVYPFPSWLTPRLPPIPTVRNSMVMGVMYMFLHGVVWISFSKAASGTETIGHRICASWISLIPSRLFSRITVPVHKTADVEMFLLMCTLSLFVIQFYNCILWWLQSCILLDWFSPNYSGVENFFIKLLVIWVSPFWFASLNVQESL